MLPSVQDTNGISGPLQSRLGAEMPLTRYFVWVTTMVVWAPVREHEIVVPSRYVEIRPERRRLNTSMSARSIGPRNRQQCGVGMRLAGWEVCMCLNQIRDRNKKCGGIHQTDNA